MTTNGGEWLTVNETAKESGYNAEYIRELIRQGKINARKISMVWLVDRKSLLAYLKKAQAMGFNYSIIESKSITMDMFWKISR